jgi:hypothetical protein
LVKGTAKSTNYRIIVSWWRKVLYQIGEETDPSAAVGEAWRGGSPVVVAAAG